VGVAAGLLTGVLLGWLVARRQVIASNDADWKTRLAARDADSRVLAEELSTAVTERDALRTELRKARVELAETQTRAAGNPARYGTFAGPDLEAQVEALERELAEMEDELTHLRAGERPPAGDSVLRNRIEELEAELATLETLRCPDPGAHRPDGCPEKPR
jgi:predicted nuclease with TOPRIM domain